MRALLISCFVLSSSAFVRQEPEGCQSCRDGVTIMFNQFSQEASLDSQVVTLVNVVCSALEDPVGCENGVRAWWKLMAAKIFVDEGALYICHVINDECMLPSSAPKSWDCETCIADVTAFGAAMSCDEAKNAVISDLSGPIFCTSEEMSLSEDDASVCQNFVQLTIPLAFDALFDPFESPAVAVLVCDSIFGICAK